MSDDVKFYFKRNKDDRFITLKKAASATAETIEIPRYYDGKYVAEIGSSAFKKCTKIKTVVIPDTVTSVARKAFAGCDIKSIVIPRTVKSIGATAFDNCVYLSDVKIENPDVAVGKLLFNRCEYIKTAVVPCSALCGEWIKYAVDLTVTGGGEIAENAFKDCNRLKRVELSEGITEICESAFYACNSLQEVILPDGLATIGFRAFAQCNALKEFTVPKTVTEIEPSAFSGCSLESLRVEEDNPVFRGVGNCIIRKSDGTIVCGCDYSAIPTDGGVKHIGEDCFSGCSFTAMEIPSSVKSIGKSAFSRCEQLIDLMIPNGVEEVGDYAFEGCASLESISLPASLDKIGFAAFDGCENLDDIYFDGAVEQWRAIEGLDSHWSLGGHFTVHCTDGEIFDYKD